MVGLFAAAAAVLAAFVAVERRVAHRVVDIGLLTHRPLAVAHFGALVLGVNQFVMYVVLPRLAELGHGLPPSSAHLVAYGFGATVTGAALMLLPGTLITIPASWGAGRLEGGFGRHAPLLIALARGRSGPPTPVPEAERSRG